MTTSAARPLALITGASRRKLTVIRQRAMLVAAIRSSSRRAPRLLPRGDRQVAAPRSGLSSAQRSRPSEYRTCTQFQGQLSHQENRVDTSTALSASGPERGLRSIASYRDNVQDMRRTARRDKQRPETLVAVR